MIVGERKPLAEIAEMLEPFRKICILGCGTCVTVCLSGGEKEAVETAAALSLWRQKEGKDVEITTHTLCGSAIQYIDDFAQKMPECDAILSLACGVGANHGGRKPPAGLNTKFGGLLNRCLD